MRGKIGHRLNRLPQQKRLPPYAEHEHPNQEKANTGKRFTWMLADGRGNVDFQVAVMDNVKPPKPRKFMHGDVVNIVAEIEKNEREYILAPYTVAAWEN